MSVLRGAASAFVPQHRWRARPPHRGGFTILEALIAAVILTASIGGLAVLITSQWTGSSDVDVLNEVENAVAADLGWLKSYAKYWRMTSGPYAISCSQAGFSAGCSNFSPSEISTQYDPETDGDLCPDLSATPPVGETVLSAAFVQAAGSVSLSPARPYPISVGSTTLLSATGNRRLPSGSSLNRTISLGRNLIYLTYSLDGSQVDNLRFRREAAVKPEAAAWCP